MIRSRTTFALLLALLAALASVGPAARAQQPEPQLQPTAATRVVFMPLVAAGGAATQAGNRFWAEQYTLPTGGCTTLHWKVIAAESVYLDGEGVGLQGQREACPFVSQFYTLEVIEKGGESSLIYEVVLSAGEPNLNAEGVIAQAAVQSIGGVSDADPAAPGNQPGYRVQLTQVRPLWVGTPGWTHAAVALDVTQFIVDLGPGRPLDWPLRVGDHVEFRAQCQGASCALSLAEESYLYLTSE